MDVRKSGLKRIKHAGLFGLMVLLMAGSAAFAPAQFKKKDKLDKEFEAINRELNRISRELKESALRSEKMKAALREKELKKKQEAEAKAKARAEKKSKEEPKTKRSRFFGRKDKPPKEVKLDEPRLEEPNPEKKEKSKAGSRVGLIPFLNKSGMDEPELKEVEPIDDPSVRSERLWRISAGVVYRMADNLEMKTGTRSSSSLIGNKGRNSSSGLESKVGPANQFANRRYKDGFVNQDPGTGGDGDTWNWGYANGGQVGGSTITFHGDGGTKSTFGRSSSTSGGGETLDGSESGVGPYVELLRTIKESDKVTCNLLVAGSYVPLEATGSSSTFSGSQNAKTFKVEVVDTYNLLGVNPPPAPYGGSFSGPGPVIPNKPARRSINESKVASSQSSEFNAIAESLDVNLTTISLGVQAESHKGAMNFQGAIGPTINLAQIEAEHREMLYDRSGSGEPRLIRNFSETADEDEFLFGGFLQGGVSFLFTEKVQGGVHGRYDWVQEADGTVGPSEFTVDLSGFSVLGTISIDL